MGIGMHELLAPVFYLFTQQAIPISQLNDHVATIANSEEYIEVCFTQS
jgi:hypothetical protein